MAKHKQVEIIKIGRRASRSFFVGERSANALVGTGKFAYVRPPAQEPPPPPPAPPAPSSDGLDDLSYWELRRRVTEAGLESEGRTKADYLAALRYRTRDMRAG
jgi:hypothetical protein